ncbi:transcriptional regulator [Rugosimonospora africana]|uniref:Transcriptional regulator n=1 Tax=Rugosimonospora africana TaxID=556532 RepID=A0A8J3QQG4_9ACTN|nr:transcriptional regulator [Rugosimonospora africana]
MHNVPVEDESGDGCLTFLVRHAWLSMRTAVAGALAEHGLSVAQYGTLLFLDGQPGCTVAEVARKVGTARQSANEMLAGLERAGLIERRAHPHDRRSQQVFITPAGRDRIAAATPAVSEAETQLEIDFTDADRATVRRWLTSMTESAAESPEEFSTH